MRTDELFKVSDEVLVRAYQEQIAPYTGLSAAGIQMELQRRAAVQLSEAIAAVRKATAEVERSSRRIERLTVWVIVLTILLLIAAALPAFEAMDKLTRAQTKPNVTSTNTATTSK